MRNHHQHFLRHCREWKITGGLGIGNYWACFQNTKKAAEENSRKGYLTLLCKPLASEEVTKNNGLMKI